MKSHGGGQARKVLQKEEKGRVRRGEVVEQPCVILEFWLHNPVLNGLNLQDVKIEPEESAMPLRRRVSRPSIRTEE